MNPDELGLKYDKISQWWHDHHVESSYGVRQLETALGFSAPAGKALDVGCGAGGRFIRILQQRGFSVTGLDVSAGMIKLARLHHPNHTFLQKDIRTWETSEKYNFIFAWDSIFHLPYSSQAPVIAKLCQLLTSGGILLYTFGNADGEHTDQWHNDTFYYSSIGIDKNLRLLMDNGLTIQHFELDQFPESHAFVIAVKPHRLDAGC